MKNKENELRRKKNKKKELNRKNCNQFMIKIIVVIIILITLILTINNLYNKGSIDNTDDKEQIEENAIERVDISHTYISLDDGVYKIYLGEISHMSIDGDNLRIEYPQGTLVNADIELATIDESYSTIEKTNSVLSMIISEKKKLQIKDESSDLVEIVEYWEKVRKESQEDVLLLDDMVLELSVKDAKVNELLIK